MESQISIKLIDKLTEHNQDLRVEYVEQTKKWADTFHALAVERSMWTTKQWCEYLNLTPRIIEKRGKTQYLFPKNFFNTADSKEHYKLTNEYSRVSRMEKDEYIDKAIDKAEKHFENSILRLAQRIIKKGININSEALEIVSKRMGVNLDTIITDGQKTVKAQTIVASGQVQRPHYRYLVK